MLNLPWILATLTVFALLPSSRSPTNLLSEPSLLFYKLLMKMTNNKGPTTNPWGTPLETSAELLSNYYRKNDTYQIPLLLYPAPYQKRQSDQP